jgi:alpha-glucosidase
MDKRKILILGVWLPVAILCAVATAATKNDKLRAKMGIASLDGRNVIGLEQTNSGRVGFTIVRDGVTLVGPSVVGPNLVEGGVIGEHARIRGYETSKTDEKFELPWGKTREVVNRCKVAVVDLESNKLRWQIELRAYDDGVAFRYRLPEQEGLTQVEVADEATRFDVVGDPNAIFNNLKNFTTSHEATYLHEPVAKMPGGQLMDMPLLLVWPNGTAAAITEGRVRNFAGMYLEHPSADSNAFNCRLSPLPGRKDVCVTSRAPVESPWRVVLLGDSAGKLLESNLLVCLNDPPIGDFGWAHPGKTDFPWWNADFEQDYKLADETKVFVDRNKSYIDFCAANGIAYHSVHGDGRAWYPQSSNDYGTPSDDADVRVSRPELDLPAIIAYGRTKGVGIRLWVHWKPLSEHLEEAFTQYEAWGVKGLMVDFLDRDDQEMLDFTSRMMESAARHKLHIQIHGSSKFSGEQRTWPNLFNREGVLNLEYLKWSDLCTPQHAVDVAYTRALTGPVDFHLGGFRSVSRADFHPRNRLPIIMGTRCYSLALYVVYENPMPMVADTPSAYEGQPGFEFLREVPTTWDETRFVAGEPGEYIVLARRRGRDWYLGGITNWTERQIDVPLSFISPGDFRAKVFVDGSMDPSKPNAVTTQDASVNSARKLPCAMAAGGGFVAILRAN